MKGTLLHGPGDIRFEEVPEPAIENPADVIIRIAATCVCGSDFPDQPTIPEIKDHACNHHVQSR